MNPIIVTVLAQIVGSFCTSVSFAVLFNAPPKCIPVGGLIGTLGWLGYFTLNRHNGSVFGASVVCALILALCSHFAAKKFQAPVQIFFVPGLIPVVPGVTFFHAIQALIEKEYTRAGIVFLDVIYISVGVACAIGLSKVILQLGSALFKASQREG